MRTCYMVISIGVVNSDKLNVSWIEQYYLGAHTKTRINLTNPQAELLSF